VSLFLELRRRSVFRVGIAYLAGAWLILQVASLVLDSFEAPAWILRALIFASAIGFPISLLLAWFYELTPEGVKTASEREAVEPARLLGRRIDYVVIASLVLALSFLLVDNYILTKPERSSGNTVGQNSIAVLPFVNLSDDPENEYFSDGLSEDILNLLAKTPGLKVVGRTSSFAFKGRNVDLRVIGDVLGVRSLLEGSVRRERDAVRITAQLIDASDGTDIWSETYDRTMTDIFAVQDDVAAAIIDELQILVGESPKRGRPTDNSEAYTLFLQARALLNEFNLREAESTVLDAIALDPNFAEAYELLANIYWAQAGGILEAPAAQELMGRTAAKALSLDPDLVLARALQRSGNLSTYSLLDEIDAYTQASLAEPDNPLILGALVFNLRRAGYLDEALDVAERLVALDPLSTMARGRWLASLFAVGRSCEAYASMSAFEPDAGQTFNTDYWLIAEANLAAGRDDAAIANLETFFEQRGISTAGVARGLVLGARDSATGEAHLDRRIAEIVASMPEADRAGMQRGLSSLYLLFGFVDRYYDVLLGLDLSASRWTDADDLVDEGMIFPALGFTSHPEYLEVAERLGISDTWEQRGPPDYCRKEAGGWVCQTVPFSELRNCK
jgi:TolB-like protein